MLHCYSEIFNQNSEYYRECFRDFDKSKPCNERGETIMT